MRIVGPALDRHIDGAARGITLLRVKHIRLYFEFLHGVGRRRKTNRKIKRIVGRAIERDLVLCRRSVDTESREVAVRDRRSELWIACIHDARCECRQLIRCSFRQRQLGNLLSLNH